MFGTINAALLGRLPFDGPDRLVMGRVTFDGNINPTASGYDYYDYRDQAQSFESLSAFMFPDKVTVLGGPKPERVASCYATWDLFRTLRVRPAAGRDFRVHHQPTSHTSPDRQRLVYPIDQPPQEGESQTRGWADLRIVLPGYLKTMGFPLLAGRDIAETDTEDSPRIMIISESMAKEFFPGQDPLGQKLLEDLGEIVAYEVVGVVADARLNGVTFEPRNAMYMSCDQVPRRTMQIVARTESNPAALTGPVRAILRAKDPNLPLSEPATMSSIIHDSLSDFRIITSALGLFSFLALLLALVGLYGALAYYVSQRYHELGVRMALGPSSRQVARLVLSRGMGLTAVGLVVGLIGSAWTTKLIQQLLFGVEPNDPATFILVASGFGLIGLMACLVPAWRATRIGPVLTLQAE